MDTGDFINGKSFVFSSEVKNIPPNDPFVVVLFMVSTKFVLVFVNHAILGRITKETA